MHFDLCRGSIPVSGPEVYFEKAVSNLQFNENPIILIADDARENELIKTNPAVTDFHVKSYLGIPLSTGRYNLGSFCVLDYETHQWAPEEIELIEVLARLINMEIDARVAAHRAGQLKAHIEASDTRFKALFDRIDPQMPKSELIAEIKAFTQQMQVEAP